MKRESAKRSLRSKWASLALAAVMMLSVIGVMPEAVSAAEKTMPAKGSTVTITDDEVVDAYYNTGGVHWIKYKANANGYLMLKFSTNSASYPSGEVQLYDGKKSKVLSKLAYFFTEENHPAVTSEYYGVKKGKTYYIKIYASRGVKIKGKFKKVTDKSGSKQKKALDLKRKKAVTGVITAGTSGTHWYKFKLSKPSKFKVIIKPYLTGDVFVSCKGPRVRSTERSVYGRLFIKSQTTNLVDWTEYNWGSNYPVYETDGKFSAGTYYIGVRPASKDCTGYFTLKWQ